MEPGSGTSLRREPWQQRLEVVVLVGLLGILSMVGWHRWAPPAYVGTGRRITLTWTCTNGISWYPDGVAVDHYSWWAGDDPVPHGLITTSEGPPASAPYDQIKRATGTIRFVSRSRAIFHSEAGGTLSMIRLNPNTPVPAECRFAADGPLGIPLNDFGASS